MSAHARERNGTTGKGKVVFSVAKALQICKSIGKTYRLSLLCQVHCYATSLPCAGWFLKIKMRFVHTTLLIPVILFKGRNSVRMTLRDL